MLNEVRGGQLPFNFHAIILIAQKYFVKKKIVQVLKRYVLIF